MATITKEQALQLMKDPKSAKEIRRAKQKRLRHKLHTEPETETESILLGPQHAKFLNWIKELLNSDENYARFKSLYRPPLFTNELAESIFSQFERVFEAQNSYEKISFSDPELENDANDYRKRIGDFQFWETQGFETFKNSIDNIVVIDLPRLQLDDDGNPVSQGLPEPYYYILDIDALVDIENTRVKAIDTEGKPFYYFKTEYVIFKADDGLVYVLDDTHYKWFTEKDGVYTFVAESAHDLGFCPARSFWTTPLNSNCTLQKRSPITNSLSEMDWLLFFSLAKKYLELYAPFPIYAVYKGKCDYKIEGQNKGRCVDGYIEYDGRANQDINSRVRCPKCSNKIKIGPGNIIELRVPKDKEDFDLMANPMKVIPAEKTSLDHMTQAIKEKQDEIFQNCVGRGHDNKTDQAQNELQIRASFESRTSVLIKIKRNFEIIHTFALDTIFRLRYGSAYLGLTINYGDEFFVKDETTQSNELELAKKTGAPSYEIATRRSDIWQTKYRNNPEMIERLGILRALEPFPDNSVNDVSNMFKQLPEIVSLKDLAIKMHFNSFVQRFEREQTNINLFARALTMDKKIALIRAEFVKYADEYLAEAKLTAPPPPAPAPPAFG